MQLEQRQTLSQKLVLTQTMRQSLDCLQLSAPELAEYVQEVALSNPLLDVQSPTYYETELPSEAAPAEREPLEVRETDSWRGVTSSGMEDVQDFTAFLTREKTFRDHLTEQIAYVAPDAEFSVQQGQLVIELNERILPRLSVNAEYAALMNTSDDPEVQRYVKEKLSEAQALIKGVHTRCDTLIQMLTLIGREQHGFFCGGEALLPVTMQQLSEKMGVSTSTVSRAAQNKYIQFQGRIIPVRSFFTTAIRPDAAVSSHAVKQRLQSLIRAEDPAAPLSDEALRLALSALGIEVSRRAVAKYRAEMGIPSSSQRKKR